MSMIRRALRLAIPLALLAACGQTPTAPDQDAAAGADGGESAGEPASGYDAIFAELEGLDQDQRWGRLIELAEEEEGTFLVYATISGDEIGPLMEDFEATVGSDEIETDFYRAGSTTVLQRIVQEADAGSPEADAVVSTGIEMEVLSNEGLLQPFETPAAENIIENAVYPDWVGVYINVYTAAWNTDLVSEAEVPQTWEDALTYTASPVGIELKSYDWFATLVTEYFMGQQGLSEEEAVQIFLDAGPNLVPVDGRTGLTEFTSAGQFNIALATYTQNVDGFRNEGAPITWESPIEPLVQRPNGVTPMADSDMPATALLFVDYLLSQDGQEVLAGFDRVPTNVNVEGAIPAEYEVVSVDVAEMVENRQKWMDLYSQVTGEPIEEEE
ncbi:MAG: extracellular solute-binding protein [Nitriliruptorales bacterium]|nr:extracellular solute-binding protein [Nitriliruptorales bacterium]